MDSFELVNLLSVASIEKLCSILKQSQHDYKLPSFPRFDITLSIRSAESVPITSENLSHNQQAVLINSLIAEAEIISAKRLTADDQDVNKVLQLTICYKDERIPYIPGDSFGIFCENPKDEVTCLLKRLGILESSTCPCDIVISSSNNRTNGLPSHIPQHSTLRHIFTSCLDIRSVPKKVLLHILSCYCGNEKDEIVLKFLSSVQGSKHYNKYIREQALDILEVLELFESCNPPVEKIIGLLPPLHPRFYSVASSPLSSSDSFQIVFNIVKMKSSAGYLKKGICTGNLDRLSSELQREKHCSVDCLASELSNLSLKGSVLYPTLFLYRRQNRNSFCYPNIVTTPIIMVGPGTGIAPFIGFLQHRELQMKDPHIEQCFGEVWLFYGCRYKEKDFLYRNQLEKWNADGIITHFHVCFSRDDPQNTSIPHYVQDNIMKYAGAVSEAIKQGAVIYVCGSSKMASGVKKTFVAAVQKSEEWTDNEVTQFFKKLDAEKRYIVDVWL